MGDIFSSIDHVELSLSDDIKLAEGVLQPKEAKEQETPEARFNRDFDKFMDELDDQLLPNIVKELEQWSDDISARLSWDSLSQTPILSNFATPPMRIGRPWIPNSSLNWIRTWIPYSYSLRKEKGTN